MSPPRKENKNQVTLRMLFYSPLISHLTLLYRDESGPNPAPPPTPTKDEERRQIKMLLTSLQSRTPALRGVVDWIVAFLGEVCERLSHFWGPALASRVMGLQAIANRHSTWFKKVIIVRKGKGEKKESCG